MNAEKLAKMNAYEVEEWSVDTRRWEIYSPKQLTNEEVFEIYNEYLEWGQKEITLYGKFEGVKVLFIGTQYGDDSQWEIKGDFKEEEE
tara:strand:- start:514 stop:777 length:264 start_codon:yes stop_codon:yes gene_type:complete